MPKIKTVRFLATTFFTIVTTSLLAQEYNERIDFTGFDLSEIGLNVEWTDNGAIGMTSYSKQDFYQGTGFIFLSHEGSIDTQVPFAADDGDRFPGWNNCLDLTMDGGFIYGGSIGSGDESQMMLARFDENADTLWTTVVPLDSNSVKEIGYAAISVADGFLAVGLKLLTGGEFGEGMVVKVDLDGDMVWKKVIGYAHSDYFTACVESHISGYILSGSTRSIGGIPLDMWIVKVNEDGELEWDFVYETEYEAVQQSIASTQDGNYVFCGTEPSSDFGGGVPLIFKFDEDGDEIWSKTYGEPTSYWPMYSIKELDNGDLISCGSAVVGNYFEGYMMKTNADGDSLWSRTFYNLYSNHCELRDVVPNGLGGFNAIGWAYANNTLEVGQDTWMIQTDSLGCIIPGCEVGVEELKIDIRLDVYPNPAHSSTNILIQTSRGRGSGTLELINAAGTIVKRHSVPGHDVQLVFPLDGIDSGVYVLRYSNEHLSSSKKLIVE